MILGRHKFLEVKDRQTHYFNYYDFYRKNLLCPRIVVLFSLFANWVGLALNVLHASFSPGKETPYPLKVWQNSTVMIPNNCHLKRKALIAFNKRWLLIQKHNTFYQRWNPGYGGPSRHSVYLIFFQQRAPLWWAAIYIPE